MHTRAHTPHLNGNGHYLRDHQLECPGWGQSANRTVNGNNALKSLRVVVPRYTAIDSFNIHSALQMVPWSISLIQMGKSGYREVACSLKVTPLGKWHISSLDDSLKAFQPKDWMDTPAPWMLEVSIPCTLTHIPVHTSAFGLVGDREYDQ